MLVGFQQGDDPSRSLLRDCENLPPPVTRPPASTSQAGQSKYLTRRPGYEQRNNTSQENTETIYFVTNILYLLRIGKPHSIFIVTFSISYAQK